MTHDEALEFVRAHHRTILMTTRSDGGAQLSPVVASVNAANQIIVSTRDNAQKATNLRRRPHATLCVFTDAFFGQWVQIDGTCEVVPLPQAMDGLVEYYRTISGEHSDWDEYRSAMTRENRVLLQINVERVGPATPGS